MRKIGQAQRGPARWCRRGTAMTEFVLAVPFLAIVLGLTFFFGWAMRNRNQVCVADRYSAWRRVQAGSWPSEADLNRDVFGGRAVRVGLSSAPPVTETVDQLVVEAGDRNPNAEMFADETIRQKFPTGKRAHVSAEFDTNEALWDKFTGSIHHRHGREGLTWRRDEASCWPTLRDIFYSDLDESLQRIPSPANRMAQMIRGLYLAHW